ncbi:MAG TPA: phosphatase PAP2 family protein [Thermodesulfovibrionales bacterium]|nr:phosphatase PAP2 family protein [Thermodesulfovibrionales bacterium]
MRIVFRFRPAESLTVIFLCFLMAVAVVFHGKIRHAPAIIALYALPCLVQIMLMKNEDVLWKTRFGDFARTVIFPIVCVLIVFDSLEALVHAINPRDIDPMLIRLDYLIFKSYPTVALESIYSPLLTDIFQIAYSTYYFLPISLCLILKFEKREHDFNRAVFLILLCFYLSYIGYMLFPALGPRYTMVHLQSLELKGIVAAEPVQAMLNSLEGIKRDAFPSGHTGVALVVSALGYRFHRMFFFVALPVMAMLIFSTVYCRYHYVVDVIGGVLLAAITWLLGEGYYGHWEARNNIGR